MELKMKWINSRRYKPEASVGVNSSFVFVLSYAGYIGRGRWSAHDTAWIDVEWIGEGHFKDIRSNSAVPKWNDSVRFWMPIPEMPDETDEILIFPVGE